MQFVILLHHMRLRFGEFYQNCKDQDCVTKMGFYDMWSVFLGQFPNFLNSLDNNGGQKAMTFEKKKTNIYTPFRHVYIYQAFKDILHLVSSTCTA